MSEKRENDAEVIGNIVSAPRPEDLLRDLAERLEKHADYWAQTKDDPCNIANAVLCVLRIVSESIYNTLNPKL